MTEFNLMVAAADGKLPEWIRLLPLGEIKLSDGREPFNVNAAALTQIVAAFRSRGIDLVVDYEHQSLQGDRAPAAGWIKELQARDDGLWGRVDWTPAASEYLKNKEYRYFSPVLRLDPKTRIPTALLHVGLTNVPAINHLSPLVAKYCGEGEPEIVFLSSPAGTPAPQQQEEAIAMLKKLIAKLGLPPETTEDQVLALVSERVQEAVALKVQVAVLPEIALAVGLEETATPAQVKGAVLALKQGAEQLTTLQAEVTLLKAESAQGKAQAAVTEALAAKKITPAQQGWALEYAARDLEGFKAFVQTATPVLPEGELKRPKSGGGKDGLDAEQLALCASSGIKPETFKASREQLIEQGLLREEG